jgi:hypothetical protein
MPLLSELNPTASGGGLVCYVNQLLPDGRFLITIGLQTFILTPSASGSHLDGTWVEVQQCPHNYQYGQGVILNDGRFAQFPGEYGSGASNLGENRVSVFNPANNTWSVVAGTPVIASAASRLTKGLRGHAGGFVSDDGRMFNTVSQVPVRIEDDATDAPWSQFASPVQTYSQTDILETPWITMPDGSAVQIAPSSQATIGGQTSYQGMLFRRFVPTYTAGEIAAGSRSGGPTATSTNLTTALFNAIDTSSVNMRWRFQGANGAVRSADERSRYTSLGPHIMYEVGPAFWMPKINKVVVVTGWGGILTINADGTGLALAARLPNIRQFAWPEVDVNQNRAEPFPVGTIRSANNGAMSVPSTLTIDVSGYLKARHDGGIPVSSYNSLPASSTSNPVGVQTRSIHIAVQNNTRWMRCTFDTMSLSGTLLTITGVAHAEGSTDALATGDLVTFGRPGLEPMDSACALLPNGDVVFCAGAHQAYFNGGFNERGTVVLKWDGVSTEAQYLTTPERDCHVPSNEYGAIPYMLPDGTLIIQSFDRAFYYTPTTAELTPFAGSRPVINSIPPVVVSGGRFTLTGTQLNGLHEGGAFGDDIANRTNFPIVRFRNPSTGTVHYCRTRDYSYRGIGVNRASVCNVEVPAIPPGTYEVEVVTHGVPCATPSTVTVVNSAGDPIFIPRT